MPALELVADRSFLASFTAIVVCAFFATFIFKQLFLLFKNFISHIIIFIYFKYAIQRFPVNLLSGHHRKSGLEHFETPNKIPLPIYN